LKGRHLQMIAIGGSIGVPPYDTNKQANSLADSSLYKGLVCSLRQATRSMMEGLARCF
jgi:hypothetical protein